MYDGKKNVSFVASDSVCREEEYLQLLRWPLVTAIDPTSAQGERIS